MFRRFKKVKEVRGEYPDINLVRENTTNVRDKQGEEFRKELILEVNLRIIEASEQGAHEVELMPYNLYVAKPDHWRNIVDEVVEELRSKGYQAQSIYNPYCRDTLSIRW